MPSRIPKLDALQVFVPSDVGPDAEIQELTSRTGQSRWYPVEGGHRVLILYEGGPFDSTRFALMKGAWDRRPETRVMSALATQRPGSMIAAERREAP